MNAKIIESADIYLQKEEKILSLARTKFSKVCRQLKISDFDQLLYNIDLKNDDLPAAIAKKVIRPILKAATDLEDALLKSCLACIDFQVQLEIIPNTDCSYRHNYKMMREEKRLLKLTIEENEYKPMVIYGLKNHTHTGSKVNLLYRNGDAVADIALVITWLIMSSIFKKVFMDLEGDAYKDILNSPPDLSHKHAAAARLLGINYSSIPKELHITYANYLELLENVWNKKWIIPNDAESRICYKRIKPLLDYKGVIVETSELSYKHLLDQIVQGYQSGIYNSIGDFPVIITQETECSVFEYDPFTTMQIMPDWFIYHRLLSKGTSNYWAVPQTTATWIVEKAFEAAYQYKHTQVNVLKNLKSLASDYAKSYQTKKNIPQKTLAAMQESIFNEYFGYVEYDEDVDLGKIQTIAEEFVAFKETYLNQIDSSDNAIRFRRLGHHKAHGLYYPSVSCLCVDINSPSSLIHEYAHLIDYCYGVLSSKAEFYQVKRLYEQCLRSLMKKNNAFAVQMNGKTKYNLSYYLNPTEIFARSYEIYVKEILKVSNSLAPHTFGDPYPTDPEFIATVKRYFETILPSISREDTGSLLLQTACQVL